MNYIAKQIMAGKFSLLAKEGYNLRIIDSMRDEIGAAVHFNINNVAEYFFAQSSQDEWDWIKDFPSVAPPFQMFWMEFAFPRTVKVGSVVQPMELTNLNRGAGMLFGVADFQLSCKLLQGNRSEVSDHFSGMSGKWMARVVLFIHQSDGKVVGPTGEMFLGVGDQGTLVAPPLIATPLSDIAENPATAQMFYGSLQPALLALSFLHCKNVSIDEHLPSRQERRQSERKGDPWSKFYTLAIDPMKKTLKTDGQSEKTGLVKAMHICRGHFAYYSEDKPLFGKYAGRFWKEAHVRGSAEIGMIGKDYKVKAA